MSEARRRLVSRGGEVELELTDQDLRLHLSEKLLHEIQAEMDKGREGARGAGAVGRFVSWALDKASRAVERTIRVPLPDLRAARYEGNALHFDYRRKPALSFESVRTDSGPVLAAFPEAEARAFADAVNARLS